MGMENEFRSTRETAKVFAQEAKTPHGHLLRDVTAAFLQQDQAHAFFKREPASLSLT